MAVNRKVVQAGVVAAAVGLFAVAVSGPGRLDRGALAVNQARRGAGLPALAVDRSLERAAESHAAVVASSGPTVDEVVGGSTPARRARVLGYRGAAGASVVLGPGGGSWPEAVARLMDGPNRANLLSQAAPYGRVGTARLDLPGGGAIFVVYLGAGG